MNEFRKEREPGFFSKIPLGLQVLFQLINSRLIILIAVSIIASQMCPTWLKSSATTSAEREWQFKMREEVLVSVDEAAMSCLLPLQSGDYESATVESLKENRKNAIYEMNMAMIGIRLLYGKEVLKKFRNEVDEPLRRFLNIGIDAKSKKGTDLETFIEHRKDKINKLSKVIDRWEDELASQNFKDLY